MHSPRHRSPIISTMVRTGHSLPGIRSTHFSPAEAVRWPRHISRPTSTSSPIIMSERCMFRKSILTVRLTMVKVIRSMCSTWLITLMSAVRTTLIPMLITTDVWTVRRSVGEVWWENWIRVTSKPAMCSISSSGCSTRSSIQRTVLILLISVATSISISVRWVRMCWRTERKHTKVETQWMETPRTWRQCGVGCQARRVWSIRSQTRVEPAPSRI